jgi:hypothetical protein
MRIMRRRSPLLALLGAGLVVSAACSDSAEAPTVLPSTAATATPTMTATRTATATATPLTVDSVRDLDFTDPLVIGPLIDAVGGGEVSAERVVYEDLTGDGVEEALAIVESGGTQGDIGFGVYSVDENNVATLAFFEQARGRVEVRVGVIVAIEGVFAAGDAECCPSQLREVTYRWDGSGFSQVSEQVIDNPA